VVSAKPLLRLNRRKSFYLKASQNETALSLTSRYCVPSDHKVCTLFNRQHILGNFLHSKSCRSKSLGSKQESFAFVDFNARLTTEVGRTSGWNRIFNHLKISVTYPMFLSQYCDSVSNSCPQFFQTRSMVKMLSLYPIAEATFLWKSLGFW